MLLSIMDILAQSSLPFTQHKKNLVAVLVVVIICFLGVSNFFNHFLMIAFAYWYFLGFWLSIVTIYIICIVLSLYQAEGKIPPSLSLFSWFSLSQSYLTLYTQSMNLLFDWNWYQLNVVSTCKSREIRACVNVTIFFLKTLLNDKAHYSID